MLAAAAMPAFATQNAGETGSIDLPVLIPDAMTLPDRALSLAGDLSGMLASGKTAAAAADYIPTDSRAKTVLQRALTLLGTPYRWGSRVPTSRAPFSLCANTSAR